ncbi:unnamed protein product, partial [Heterosigma akashiwo]
MSLNSKGDLIIGLNKYSHDVSCCILSRDGTPLFIGEKERITRRKHDGGDASLLVEHALESIGAKLEDIGIAVSNNHHFPVGPFEETLPWAVAVGHYPQSYLSPFNLLPHTPVKHEISHHLAHAWSVVTQCPFDEVSFLGGGGGRGGLCNLGGRRLRGALVAAGRRVFLPSSFLYFMVLKDNNAQQKMKKQQRQEPPPPPVIHVFMLRSGWGAGHGAAALLPGRSRPPPPGFVLLLRPLGGGEGWREGESAYVFGGGGAAVALRPLAKRWARERSPPELENHGFENMESMGAVYSRVASHIFGDWNSCGKVMGLAPWHRAWGPPGGGQPGAGALGGGGGRRRLFRGALLSAAGEEGAYAVDWDLLAKLPHPNELEDKSTYPFYGQLAYQVQKDLEETALSFIRDLRERTGAKNLCLAGGVALNSVLNGRISEESGFENVYIPPYPGDEGVAVGCAVFGLHNLQKGKKTKVNPPRNSGHRPRALLLPLRATADPVASSARGTPSSGRTTSGAPPPPPLLPPRRRSAAAAAGAQGKAYGEDEVLDALGDFAPWVEVERFGGGGGGEGAAAAAAAAAEERLAEETAAEGQFGPRALGHRSLLADPRDPDMVRRLNAEVKRREDFRPFAPSVLAEEAEAWFPGLAPTLATGPEAAAGGAGGGGHGAIASPFMSLTARARWPERTPAVCHVDGSSRLQTVRAEDNPGYHRLIRKFFALTGVPMVLNTSFNIREPIVESPRDALKCFLAARGAIDQLVLENYRVTRKHLGPAAEEGGGAAGGGGGRAAGGRRLPPRVRRRWPRPGASIPARWLARTASPFLSEVAASARGEALRVRVRPLAPTGDEEAWLELGEVLDLNILELA